MPTYTYVCKKCGHTFDVFHSIVGTHTIACEECASKKTERQIGIGSGIIFKGSGFYETDYKTKKGTPPASEGKSEGKSGDVKSTDAKTGESKKADTKKTDTGGGASTTATNKKTPTSK